MPQNVTGKSAWHIAGVDKCLLFLEFLEVAGNGSSEITRDHNKRLGWVFLFVLLLLLLFVFGFVGFSFFWPHHAIHGLFVPQPGLEPQTPALEA